MTRKIFLFFFFSFMSSSFLGQSIQPSLLEIHGKKIYIKGNKSPYSGTLEGYVYYRDIRPVHEVMFQVKSFIFNANYQYLDSFPAIPYIKGNVVNGKAEGEWKFYQFQDSILIAECSFINSKIDGNLIIYDIYNLIDGREIIQNYRKGKFILPKTLDSLPNKKSK